MKNKLPNVYFLKLSFRFQDENSGKTSLTLLKSNMLLMLIVFRSDRNGENNIKG